MKKNLITVLLVFLLPLIAYFMLNTSSKNDFASVDAKTTRPQVIKFTSTMCLDCQTMNKIMKEIFPQYRDRIDLVEVNVQDNQRSTQDWIKKHDVTLVPTIILIDSNGNQVKRIEGAIEKELMDEYLQGLK